MDVHPTTNDGDGGGPTLAQPGVVKTRCSNRLCGREDRWMDDGFPHPDRCVECNAPLIVTAATGETIEQAIQAAAQELPERTEPVQPTIPGLRPAFDLARALAMIEEHEREASDAERAYSAAHERAKQLRKEADALNLRLRTVIRDLNHRRHDARYEPPESEAARDALRGDADVVSVGAEMDGAGSVAADRDQCSDLEPDRTGTDDGRGHDAENLDVDAQPADVADCSNVGTLALLHQAGASNITLQQVEVWTEEQVVLARAWAEEQIEANETAAFGTVVSVLWPSHVSLAHHGPEITKHTPQPKPKKRTTRRRSR